jgi:ketosteroid isomerase-like protein
MSAHRTRLAVALPLVLASAAAAQPALLAELRAAEAERFAATLKRDTQALGRLLADDMTYTHSSGVVEAKAEFIAAVRDDKYKYRALEATDQRVRSYGDVAVVTGIAHVTLGAADAETKLKIRYIEVFVKRGGRWQLAAWQSTRLQQ